MEIISVQEEYFIIIDVFQQKMTKSTGVLIGTDLNSVQFNSQVANAVPEDTASMNSKKETSDFNMPIDGNEQGRFIFKNTSHKYFHDFFFSR